MVKHDVSKSKKIHLLWDGESRRIARCGFTCTPWEVGKGTNLIRAPIANPGQEIY